MIETYNEFHLGDQLHHLNYLRKLKQPCVHYCHQEYHHQLRPLIEGTDIVLKPLEDKTPDSENAWIGRNNFYYSNSHQGWTQAHLLWFSYLSRILGIDNPINSPEDLLFDYPALKSWEYPTYDYLIINSVPMSNQLPGYDSFFFANKTRELLNKGHSVITTLPTGLCQSTVEMGMSITDIGNLSISCENIIAVETGPLWPTFNIFNKNFVKTRTVYSQAINIDLLNAITLTNLQPNSDK